MAHLVPPSVVAMMAPPVDGPACQPTAQQLELVGHEMPSIFITPPGTGSVVQVTPPSAVATTSFSFEVTAQQWDESGQEMAAREVTPEGGVCKDHEMPAFVVATMVLPPTAQHREVVGHDTASRPWVPAGRASFTQCPEPGLEPFTNASISPVLVVTPPFLLTKEPAAQHAVVLGHATARRVPTLRAASWLTQVLPRSRVVMIELPPTAQHTVVAGHDTPVNSGGDFAACVCIRHPSTEVELAVTRSGHDNATPAMTRPVKTAASILL
jgi:hypothetical protein